MLIFIQSIKKSDINPKEKYEKVKKEILVLTGILFWCGSKYLIGRYIAYIIIVRKKTEIV